MRPSALALALLSLGTGPALAGFPCDELWAERNATYKDAGYCFKTARAIRAFGNAARQRADIADIQRRERENDCPR